jgi:hypothetical protein
MKKGGEAMGEYLLSRVIDRTRVPVDSKEREVEFNALLEMVRQDIKADKTNERGIFVVKEVKRRIGEHLLADILVIQPLKEVMLKS